MLCGNKSRAEVTSVFTLYVDFISYFSGVVSNRSVLQTHTCFDGLHQNTPCSLRTYLFHATHVPAKIFPIIDTCCSIFKLSSRLDHILEPPHKSFFSNICLFQHPTHVFRRALSLTSSIPSQHCVSRTDSVSQQSTCYPRLTVVVFDTPSWRWQAPFYLPLSLNSPPLSAFSSLLTLILSAMYSISHFLCVSEFLNL